MNRLVMIVLRNILIVPQAYAKLQKHAKDPDRYSDQEMWDHLHNLLKRAVERGNVDLVCTGLENLPADEGFLMYGNHQGLFDVMALAATCHLPLTAVAKKELDHTFFVKDVLTVTHSYYMDRSDARQSLKVMRQVAEDVREKGRKVVIFPEGTRSRKGNEMTAFHDGSFKPALRAKCPIVPVAFVNSFIPIDRKGTERVEVHIHYLDPIPYEEFKDKKTPEIANMVKARIQAKIDEVLGTDETV